MGEEFSLALHFAEETVGTERLHETLHRALDETPLVKLARFGVAGLLFEREIISDEIGGLPRGELAVGIVDHRGEIILGQPPAQTLVVDQETAAITQHHVRALEIAMDETAAVSGKFMPERGERGMVAQGRGDLRRMETLDIIREEIIPFPLVKRLIERSLEFRQIIRSRILGHAMERKNGAQSRFVGGTTGGLPTGAGEIAEIGFAEILDPEEPQILAPGGDGRGADVMAVQEIGDRGEARVVGPVEFVMHRDEAAVTARLDDTNEESARAALFDDGESEVSRVPTGHSLPRVSFDVRQFHKSASGQQTTKCRPGKALFQRG